MTTPDDFRTIRIERRLFEDMAVLAAYPDTVEVVWGDPDEDEVYTPAVLNYHINDRYHHLKWSETALLILLLLIVGGGLFFAGRVTGP